MSTGIGFSIVPFLWGRLLMAGMIMLGVIDDWHCTGSNADGQGSWPYGESTGTTSITIARPATNGLRSWQSACSHTGAV